MLIKRSYGYILLFGIYTCIQAQKPVYTHADSLKGGIGKARDWWDALHYDLHVEFGFSDSTVQGVNKISYKVLRSDTVMQIDLMQPMVIDSIVLKGSACKWKRDGNAFFVNLPLKQVVNDINLISLYFHGKPKIARNPPWEGGVVWARDKKFNPWISIACQGMAAQVWFPNKDHMYDEPDSAAIHIVTPADLMAVSNGRLRGVTVNGNKTITYHWAVVNPINNYNIIPYIGKYAVFKDTLAGEAGTLDLDFWVMRDNYALAKKHFEIVKPMIRCFEEWFGPYPFYEDGYKLVEAPFLGMEHQSAIAYGNDYMNGYKGRDLSVSGWGMKWDFVIVHESGHEWFGNSISAQDVADNWIHESFTAYSENLFVEYLYGKKAGAEYVTGTRFAVLNDKPVISDYHVNAGGSLDIYYKGANMLHTIRQIVNNDSLWKEMLRGINKTFRHKTVTTRDIEDYMITFLGFNLQPVFDQYLRTTKIPVLEYKIRKNKLSYRWRNCVKGFNMPLKIYVEGKEVLIVPKERWQRMGFNETGFRHDTNYYVSVRKV